MQTVNWQEIQGKWNQWKGKARQEWGKLTDDDLARIEGQRDELIGLIQERYGIAREEAQQQVEKWTEKSLN